MAPKGHTNNPHGRPKGTPNKVTQDLKTWVYQLLSKNRKLIEQDMNGMEPHQRSALFEKLLAYAIPKLQRVEAEATIDFNTLSNEQLNQLITELTKHTENEQIEQNGNSAD